MLLMDHLPALHWALAGAAIGAVTILLLYIANKRLGVSSGLESLCALVSRRPFFRRSPGQGWRLLFLAGLTLGGVLSRVLAGGWSPMWNLGRFDAAVGWGLAGKVAWMFCGGVFIGFGTRLAQGCTSGHGIFGVANREPASLASTAAFMLGGIATTNLVYRVLFAP